MLLPFTCGLKAYLESLDNFGYPTYSMRKFVSMRKVITI